jgi:hypothetical protein
MSIHYENEKLFDIPIPEDSVSFGKISAQGITALVEHGGIVISGNYSLPSVTITFKGITTAPTPAPGKTGFGATFTFRGKSWTVIDVTEGAKFRIAGIAKFSSWSLTAVSFTSGRVSIG